MPPPSSRAGPHSGWPITAANYAQPWQRIEAFKVAAKSSARKPDNAWQPGAFGAGILDALALLQFPLPEAATLTRDGSNA